MKRITKAIIPALLLSISLINGCSTRSDVQAKQTDTTQEAPAQTDKITEETYIPYTFTAQSSMEYPPDSSLVCWLIEEFDENYGNNCALIYGKLKTLFGEPVYETEDNENLYSYCILATSKDGDTVYLDVYEGPSGPAIGGMHDEETLKAAQALTSYIWQAEASDYECTSYYPDTLSAVTMGVRDGIPYYEEKRIFYIN